MTDAARIEQEAAEWIARIDRAEPSPCDDAVAAFAEAGPDFARWIGASTQNRVAFLRLFAAWGRADRLAALATGDNASIPQRGRRFAALFTIAASAAAACLAVAVFIGLGPLEWAGGPRVYETAVGGRETVPLADGSRIELNTDTRLAARISEKERAVILERGEAWFDVARDETRPFIVEAGDKRVTVLGTKFTVRREAGEVEVIVVEGTVRIEELAENAVLVPTIAEKGTQVLARAEGALVRKKAELDAELGWRRGLLIFDQMDLQSVAAEFNRYNRVKLIIADPEAASIRIGGCFRAENVDAFARLLKDGFGLKVERDGEKIVIKA